MDNELDHVDWVFFLSFKEIGLNVYNATDLLHFVFPYIYIVFV